MVEEFKKVLVSLTGGTLPNGINLTRDGNESCGKVEVEGFHLTNIGMTLHTSEEQLGIIPLLLLSEKFPSMIDSLEAVFGRILAMEVEMWNAMELNEEFHELLDFDAVFSFNGPVYDELLNVVKHYEHLMVYMPSHGIELDLKSANWRLSLRKHHSGEWTPQMLTSAYMHLSNSCTFLAHTDAQDRSNHSVGCYVYKDSFILSGATPFISLEGILTIVFSAMSIAGLLASLILHTIVSVLRSSYGRLVLNVKVCVLLGHIIFLVNTPLAKYPTICMMMSALQHYVWLASFFWMNILCFNALKSFQRLTADPSSHRNKSVRLFMLYGWGTPLCIVAACILLHYFNLFQYGNLYVCWIVGSLNIGLSFGLPVAALLLSNLVLFIATYVYLKNSMDMASKVSNSYSRQQRFVLYIKLSSIMGLSWMLGFLSNIPQLKFLRFAFIALSCSNGLFLSLCFTLSPRMFRILKEKMTKTTTA